MAVSSNEAAVVLAGPGHPVDEDLLAREAALIEDIARYLRTHNEPRGIWNSIVLLDKAGATLYRLAGGGKHADEKNIGKPGEA